MKYNIINMETGLVTYRDSNEESKDLSDRDKLDRIDDKVIESYIREKKLKKINKNK